MAEVLLFAIALASTHILPAFGVPTYEHLHLDEAFLIPMILLMGAEWQIATTFLLGVCIGQLLQGKPWYKVAFNMLQMSLASLVAAVIAHTLGLNLFSAAIGAIVYSFTSLMMVAWIVNKVEKVNLFHHIPSTLEFRGVMLATGLCLGVATYLSITSLPVLFPVAASAVIGLQTWYAQSRVPQLQLVGANE